MKYLSSVLLAVVSLFSFLFLSSFSFAQEVVANLPISDAVGQIWGMYLEHKGSTLGLIFVIVQGLMLLTKTEVFSFVKGKGKILLVSVLTLAASIVANLVAGNDWISMIGDATVMSALQVLLHQVVKKEK